MTLCCLLMCLMNWRRQRSARLIDRLWRRPLISWLVVEPGTPAGWSRILSVRAQLVAAGAHLVAPCPHALACPLTPPDWCHFSRRVARSRMHRQVKLGDVPWEDEKFIYIAASRQPGRQPQARVIAPPIVRGGTVSLKLCENEGVAALRLRVARGTEQHSGRPAGVAWGDVIWPDAIIPADSAASSSIDPASNSISRMSLVEADQNGISTSPKAGRTGSIGSTESPCQIRLFCAACLPP